MSILRPIDIRNAHPRLRLDKKAVTQVIRTLDAHRERFDGGCPDGELSLAFLTDRALAKLHGDFLDDPTTTDVITFEGQPELGVAGEVCVSADTAATFAKTHGKKFSEELTLYVVHGWLHLAGYDDLVPAKKRRMRAAEARAIKILRAVNGVPSFTLKPLSRSLNRSRSPSVRTPHSTRLAKPVENE
ncbi:MAG TPA: rRNA maturation RNase YbeY [Rariglobus sp.]|jgi:probable rRNA maturation factor|nr:rRNA maturation RNase YbeY [Rariglobus sp.]